MDSQTNDKLTQGHTPGPWTQSKFCVQAARGRDGHPGFTVADTQTFSSYGISDAERFANVALIAAAPDLLAALTELELRTRQFIAGTLTTFPASLLPQVRHVLKIARGQQ